MEATCVVNDRPVLDDGSHHNGNHAKHPDQIACLIRAPQAKSCIPCRLRKVKCSGGQPCQTCIKRAHPQLCSYSPETSKQLRRSRARSERHNGSHRRSDLPSRALDLSPVSQSHPQRASSDHRGDSYSTCDNPNNAGGQDVTPQTARDNSVLALLSQASDQPAAALRPDVRSALGLRNSISANLFSESESLQSRWESLIKIIPRQSEILQLYPVYRNTAHLFNPIVARVDQFETSMFEYLQALDSGVFESPLCSSKKWADNASVDFIALLLATLSLGAHFLPQSSWGPEYSLQFLKRAFTALQLANYLFRPTHDNVQTLLLVGACLQNNGQSSAAWAMLGTTARLAQSLGLHQHESAQRMSRGERTLWWVQISSTPDTFSREERANARLQCYRRIIGWQDVLLCLCHDQRPIIHDQNIISVKDVSQPPQNLSFLGVMDGIVRAMLEALHTRESMTLERRAQLVDELDLYKGNALPHLQQFLPGASLQERSELFAMQMNMSFAISVLCRPALQISITHDNPLLLSLLRRAKQSLIDVCKAFLDFQAISIVPVRSWGMVHSALSSALLLSVIEETRQDPYVCDLQGRVLRVFSRHAQAVESAQRNGENQPEQQQWLSSGHMHALLTCQRALQAHHSTSLEGTQRAPAGVPVQAPLEPCLQPLMSANGAFFDSSSMIEDGLSFDFEWLNGESMQVSPMAQLDMILNEMNERPTAAGTRNS
ncbi:uncharacterized protein E0L32_008773 [Thyridium curvatum]|uniref:Zn(2)-C6 fungal-type domain-containing protein n=1 Tax=Thyridium curvatum TaxID=1093900 RepID=A0A507B054_9PEZI|nr:uncharacterized protein E0L32_008773 [Thyridium curvatum]TPX10368.1 hypothetical protein E0L32_008773 [Thyridium curvatum]